MAYVDADQQLVDVVETWEQARALPEPPLIVLEGLRAAIGLDDEELEVERISAGHSNVTFTVRSSRGDWVLRRPPRPPFSPSAHDVEREYRMLAALGDSGARVPSVRSMHATDEAIGAPFYLMESIPGQIIRDRTAPPLDTPEQRSLIGEELIDALCEVHEAEWRDDGIAPPGRSNGYLERQLSLWTRQWGHNSTREVPLIAEVGEALEAGMPGSSAAAVVHGDYKLDNVIFGLEAPARLVGILDWEMSTIGDPLADLGYLTATWIESDEDPDRLLGLSAATREPGFPTRAQLAERYAAISGRDLSALPWYQGLALWKLAILLEASYGRFLAGTTDDPFFARLDTGVPRLAEQARRAIAGEPLE